MPCILVFLLLASLAFSQGATPPPPPPPLPAKQPAAAPAPTAPQAQSAPAAPAQPAAVPAPQAAPAAPAPTAPQAQSAPTASAQPAATPAQPVPAPVAPAAQAPGAIRFQLPTDASGAIAPVVMPQKPDTVQKLGHAGNFPLNLIALSAKDTASFETYSKRLALVQDSISANHRAIEQTKKNTVSFMPPFAPKDEFEKQVEYDARKAKYDKELAERVDRDTRSFTLRLSELERAKKKIEENQVSLYGSLTIRSNIEAVSVWLGKEEIGLAPLEYKYLIPGPVNLSVRKDGYIPFDTTFEALPGAKLAFNAYLEEKSIFSPENEIDFHKLLSKDTTAEGYALRMRIVEARSVQVDGEIKYIMDNFSNIYPALEPQKPDETPESFAARREAWTTEGMRQIEEFKRKYDTYKLKLARSLVVLNDYIISEQSVVFSEVMLNAKIELGAYDPDREHFELAAHDIENERTPFYFKGIIGIPRDTARIIDRAKPGLLTSVQYINFPFKNSVNLAMSNIQISRNGVNFRVEGSFSEIERYKSEEGYDSWKPRADSLKQGTLKPQGLDYAYAVSRDAVKFVDPPKKESSGGLGWRGWTRIITFTAAAICGGLAIRKHSAANDKRTEWESVKADAVNYIDPEKEWEAENIWKPRYVEAANALETEESGRNTFSAMAAVFAAAGTLTFFF